MTKTARRKARKGAKKTPTIAMMTVEIRNATAATEGKWGQGAYRAKRINYMINKMGFSASKAEKIANINAGL